MKKRYEWPLRMWCDVVVVSLPLFVIGLFGDKSKALWISVAIFVISMIGIAFSIYYLFKGRQLRETPLSKDISMAVTYVWPCILSGLIVDHFGNDGLPFYILAGFVMVVIIFVNHNDLM
ncbi:MAG: hypothetical protein K2J46_07565 [Muribaculaceae bacterium]|nr:hypothetical protein [Muribaculaceae bacterium]